MKTVFFISVLFILAGCGAAGNVTDIPTTYPSSIQLADSISFLVFHITKGSIGSPPAISLVSKKTVAGKLKPQAKDADYPSNLQFVYLNGREALQSQRIEHPLYKKVEYADDAGAMTSANTHLDSTEFFIRVQLPVGTNKLLVFETISGKISKKGTLINL